MNIFKEAYGEECGREKIRRNKEFIVGGKVKGTSNYSRNIYTFIRDRRQRKADGISCAKNYVFKENVGLIWYLDGVTEGASSVESKQGELRWYAASPIHDLAGVPPDL